MLCLLSVCIIQRSKFTHCSCLVCQSKELETDLNKCLNSKSKKIFYVRISYKPQKIIIREDTRRLGKICSNNKVFIHCKLIVEISHDDSNDGVPSISLLCCKVKTNVSEISQISEIILNEFVNVLILNLKKGKFK